MGGTVRQVYTTIRDGGECRNKQQTEVFTLLAWCVCVCVCVLAVPTNFMVLGCPWNLIQTSNSTDCTLDTTVPMGSFRAARLRNGTS